MNKSKGPHFLSLKRLLSPCGAVLVALLLLAPVAQATPYVVKLTEQGDSVVASGSGAFDLTGLTLFFKSGTSNGGGMLPSLGFLDTTPQSSVDVDFYSGFQGPTSYGEGSETLADSGGGDVVGIVGDPSVLKLPLLLVPAGYVSETALSSTATWNDASFASLGVTPGTYVWTWGTGADQRFTFDIGAVSVPGPSALGMFGFGVLLAGGFIALRRRVA